MVGAAVKVMRVAVSERTRSPRNRDPSPDSAQRNSRANQGRLFDHLVGADEQRLWHRQTERHGRLEVDHQLEFGWLLDRQVGGCRTLEDLSDRTTELPLNAGEARAIANQAAGTDVFTPVIDRWNSSACH